MPVERLVSGEVGLDGIEGAFAAIREQRGLKYVLRPWQARMSATRVALVTGGGRGIGRATAVALARAGARVTVTARTHDEVAAVAERDRRRLHRRVGGTPRRAAPRSWRRRGERSGPIDILVCSAGIGAWGEKPIWELSDERWRETLATNLDGPFYLSRLVTAEMTQRGFGRIVFVSSTAGEVGGPEQPAYCASKHGVIGLMRAIAQDVIPFGVTCNAVLPGWVRTRMADDDVAEESRRTGRSPEEVWAAHAAEYAAGPRARPGRGGGRDRVPLLRGGERRQRRGAARRARRPLVARQA